VHINTGNYSVYLLPKKAIQMLHYYQPVFNINTITEKQQTFLCEFVDIKRNGWMHYSKALNNMTGDFWKPWLDETDKQINNLAESMKLAIRLK
jgi:hypothetical protein